MTVPQVLQVVAGVPIELTLLNVTAGKGTWLETTSCGPGGHWPFSVSTGYNTGGSSKFTASIRLPQVAPAQTQEHLQAMRRPVALAAVLLAGTAAAALAQPSPITVTVTPKVTPNKAGTPAHPQGVKLDLRLQIHYPPDYQLALVQTVDVWFPKGGLYNGDKFPTCSYNRLNALGPAGCPKDSIMGHGTGVATADTNFTYPKITIVNGGQHVVFAYTILNNPARVQTPVVGKITKLSGRWSYKLHVGDPEGAPGRRRRPDRAALAAPVRRPGRLAGDDLLPAQPQVGIPRGHPLQQWGYAGDRRRRRLPFVR